MNRIRGWEGRESKRRQQGRERRAVESVRGLGKGEMGKKRTDQHRLSQ